MIAHIFQMIWKNRKKSFILVIEFSISIVGLIAIIAMVTDYINNKGLTLGYKYENVYQIEFFSKFSDSNEDRYNKELKEIIATIKQQSEVVHIGYWHFNPPFSQQQNRPGGDLKYNHQMIDIESVDLFNANEDMADIFSIHILQGRWFEKADMISKDRPAIINERLKKMYFNNKNPIGEIMEYCGNKCKVVGVIDDFRYMGEFSKPKNVFIVHETFMETVSYKTGNCISCNGCGWDIFFFKTRTDDLTYEAKLVTLINTRYPDWVISINPVSKLHKNYLQRTWVPVILMSVVIVFVLSNVLFGLFGLLWYNISLRKSEIGLRMSVGANKNAIYKQFIGEMLVLATLGIIPGILIAAQFCVFNAFNIETNVYITAMLVSTALIYLLVTLCALFPSAQATKIQPAEALHDE
jgi:putative ABC transport system permease protein